MSTTGGSVLPPISQLTTTPTANTQLPGSTNGQLGANAFLQLLTTELQNQDPTQPMDDTQSVSQLAQFSALQYQQQLTSSFQSFQSNFGVLQTASLIGKQVTVVSTDASGNTSNITGAVSTIDVQNGVPYFTMTNAAGATLTDNNGNPLLFSTTSIIGIGG